MSDPIDNSSANGVKRRVLLQGGAGMAGEDGGFTSLCIAIEEIGRVDQSMGITLEAAVGLGINPILTFGTAEQKETWLPALVAGEKIAGMRAWASGRARFATSTEVVASSKKSGRVLDI